MMKRSSGNGGNGIGVIKYEAHDIKRESDVGGKNVDNVIAIAQDRDTRSLFLIYQY